MSIATTRRRGRVGSGLRSGGDFGRGFLFAVLLVCECVSRGADAEARRVYQAPGTRRMAEILQRWIREFGERNPYVNLAEVKRLQQELAKGANAPDRVSLQFDLAAELLNLGRPEEALVTLTNLYREPRIAGVTLGPKSRRNIRILEGLAYLRLGELENCIQHHNPDSCLLPIRGAGQHTERRGAQNAEAIFLELARQKTNDLGARWLLNIAAMTLGKYPAGVPADVLIPPAVFEPEAAFPKFPEIATKLGIGVDDLSGGTIAEDFDGDGWLDVMLSSFLPGRQCRLYKNLGDGHFEEVTEKSGLTGVTGGLTIMQADYNNDGWPDVYIVRGAWLGEMGLLPDSLLRNNGDGTFADVTQEAGLLSFHPALSAVWFDANNDGWIDLFVGNESREGEPPHPCQLFLNNRNGTFTECAQAAGVALVAFVRGVTAGDYDNDGWPDLYVSCLGHPNILLHNDGKAATNTRPGGHFTDVTPRARVSEPILSFPTWFWDYDNDGWPDIFACGYGADPKAFYNASAGHSTLVEVVADKLGLPTKAEKPRLYRNNRDGTFADVTHEAHLDHALLAMGANFGDLDNDGFLDFYLGTGTPYFGSLLPNEMFRNNGGKVFQNVTTAGGFGHLQKGHAIAFADLNHDGQQDVVLNVGGGYLGDTFFDAVFANPGNRNHWVFLKMIGRQSNRAAIGARVKVVASSKGRTREIHRTVGTGGSFGSNPLRQEIGLGDCDQIERVEVWWPVTGRTNTVTRLQPDHFYELAEGQNSARLLDLKPFIFPGLTARGAETR